MTQFTLPFDIESLEITNQSLDSKGNIIFDVVSKATHSTIVPVVSAETPRQNELEQPQ